MHMHHGARNQRTCGVLFLPTMGISGIELGANSGLTASTEPSYQPITQDTRTQGGYGEGRW